MAEVALLVGEQEAPDIYKLSEEVDVEVGPFTVSTRLALQTFPFLGCCGGEEAACDSWGWHALCH